MKAIFLICAGLLLLALASLPIGYYTFLRIIITIVAGSIVVTEFKNGINFWVITFGFIAIIFNPLIPVYLGNQNKWLPIEIITAILFIIKSFKNKNSERKNLKR